MGGYDEYNYDDKYDEDDLPDYVFNETDTNEKPAVLVESNKIPEEGVEEEDATRDVVPENIEVEATREGKILGGASVKSLDAASMSREEVVLTSEEAIRDASSSVLDDEVMKVEEFRDEKAEKDEAKKPERGRS